jgi:glycosyltransferase involved in cell wall biosynthesis
MSKSPLVSVVIPTYNRADVVCEAIDSVLQQTYSNTEILVVDDGSKDDTLARLSVYGDRIRILSQQNAGPSVARNRGIAAAKGEIISFLDSDDYWLPTKLSRQVELLEKVGDSVACCLCNCTILYHDGSRKATFDIADLATSYSTAMWKNPAEVLSTRFVIFTQAVAIRREVLERVGYFDESLPFYSEDYELSLRLAIEGPWAIIRDELVVCQDASPGSLGQKALREELRFREGRLHMRQRISNLVEGNPRHFALRGIARRELRRAKRDLMAVRLSHKDSAFASGVARSLRFAGRLESALFRRSPMYPRVVATELN